MIFNKENYPEACKYLGIGSKPTEETPLDSDIETITGILPRLVSDAEFHATLCRAVADPALRPLLTPLMALADMAGTGVIF